MAELDKLLDMVERGKVSLSASVIPTGPDEPDPLEIIINTHGGPLPEKHGEWIDLCTSEDVHMKAMEYRAIDLGVSMKLPDGYYAVMAPRSSTFAKFGVLQTNSIGIFEQDFCGDGDRWVFPALAMRETFIPKGSRICQFQLVKQAESVIFKQDVLSGKNRGGLGSTGEKATAPDDWKKG